MYKKYLITFILSILILINSNETIAKYAFTYTLDVANCNTRGNYYLITYTGKDDPSIEKVEKLYKGDNHDEDGEILRNWLLERKRKIETIKIEDTSGDIKDCSYLFGKHSEVALSNGMKKIDLSSFNTENVTNMSYMFYDCVSLTELNISNLNTSKVTDMSCMFYYCQSMKSFDLRSFDTTNVTDMNRMFSTCKSLEEIKVSPTWTIDNSNTLNMYRDCGVSSTILYN